MGKIDDKQLKNIPIKFTKLKEYESNQTDDRFTEVLIKILHLGKNLNGSIFNKSVVESAIPTLANTPILGFIEENNQNEDDFSDHRIELVDDNGKLKMRYMGNAYGVISESQAREAYFSTDLCSDGIEREFLNVHGLLFNKFDYVIDLFKEHDGAYSQSMELSDNYTGHFSDDGFIFDSFEFNGACIITCDPAMIDSEITTNFSIMDKKSISEEIENKLNQFTKYFSEKEEKNENMAKNKIENKIEETQIEEVKENFSAEQDKVQVVEENKPSEEFTKEETKENFDTTVIVEEDDDCEEGSSDDEMDMSCNGKMKNMSEDDNEEEDFACGEDKKNTPDDKEKTSEEMSCGGKKKFSLNFELSHEDIACQLYDKLCSQCQNDCECCCCYIVKTMDNYFIYTDICTGQYFEQPYLQTDTEVILSGDRKEVFSVFVDQPTMDAMSNMTYAKLQEEMVKMQNKIKDYTKANEKLVAFKNEVEENERKSEIDGVISNFSTVNELDLENYRQKAYNKELNKEQLEKELYALVGKMNFSKITGEKVEEQVKIATNYTVSLQEQEVCPYEGCEDLFR